MTYPLVVKFDHAGRLDNNDGRFSVWNVAWVAHALTTDPLHVYDANSFYPHTRTLTYSEPNLGAGVFAVPAWLATKNPYAAHNSAVLLAFMFSGIGAYYLCRHLTGSRAAAAVGAILYAYCPFVFARTAHIQLMMIGGLPFCLLAFHRLMDTPTVGRSLALGALLWIQAMFCGYYGIFAGLLVGLGAIVFAVPSGRWRRPGYWGLVGLAALTSVVLVAPFFAPYLDMQRDTGFARTLEGARTYSANWQAWLASAAWAHRWWLPGITGFSEVLFPGIVTLVLGAIGFWVALARPKADAGPSAPALDRPARTAAWFYAVTALLTFWVTFGPAAGVYTLLYRTIPVFSFLRAPARTGIVVTLCLVVMASLAVARWLEGRRRAAWWAAGLALIALADVTQAPLFTRDARPVSAAYQELARLPRAPVVVFPFWARPIDFHGHAEYLLASTAHWQPLINGYGDHIPQDFRDNAPIIRQFPSRESWALLERLGARYVAIHLYLYPGQGRDEVIASLQPWSDYLRPLSQVDDVWLYEIVGFPR